MTTNQESQWREEFENKWGMMDLFSPTSDYGNSKIDFSRVVYIEARKKAQEEVSEIEKRYEKMIDDYHSRLIASLKKAKERDELIKECIQYVDYAIKYSTPLSQKGAEILIEKAKKMVGGKWSNTIKGEKL